MKDLGIDKLAPEQRVALAREIWDSLDDAQAVPPISDAFRAELDRRDAEMDANPGIAMTWAEMRAKLGWRSSGFQDSTAAGRCPLNWPLSSRSCLL